MLEKTIDRTGEYLRTDIRYLLKGGSWLGIGQLISTAALFLLSVAFANLLPKETYGIYKYIFSIVNILSIPTLTGMDPAVTQAVARGYESTIFLGFKTKLKWGTLASLASLVLGIFYFVHGNVTLTFSFLIVAVFVPFSEAYDIYNALLTGKKLFKTFTFYNASTQVISTAVMITVLFFNQSVPVLVFTYFLANFLLNVLFYFRSLKKSPPNENVAPETIPYGKHLSLIYIISTVLTELDKILVFHYLGAADLAVYTVSIAPTEQMKGIMKNLNLLALPRFAERSSEELKKTLLYKVIAVGIFIVVVTGIFIVLAPAFYGLFFPKYLAAVRYAQIISLSLAGVVLSMFIYTVLESQKAQRELYQFNIYSNAFNLIILFFLIHYYGLMGAILARLFSRYFNLALSVVLVRRIK
jgi:O-antigen/teichoic acid export membrane protein